MDKLTKWTLAVFFVFLMSIPGPILLLIYKIVISSAPENSVSLFAQRPNVAVILATYAFTMLGFLAAVIAILLNFSQSTTFKKYKNNKYLDIFFIIYFYCIITLALTFGASLLTLASASAEIFMRSALSLATNSVIQVATISTIIINICRKSL
ncbi:hypothetical protein [Azotobacter salinestris]|uniref:hypothetical protein n=1 Tax=Azotobacter salinestris TaxID=69964 RepID=UPI001266A7EF